MSTIALSLDPSSLIGNRRGFSWQGFFPADDRHHYQQQQQEQPQEQPQEQEQQQQQQLYSKDNNSPTMFSHDFHAARQTTGDECPPLSPICIGSSPASSCPSLFWNPEQQQQELKRRYQDRAIRRGPRRPSTRQRNRRLNYAHTFADVSTAVMSHPTETMSGDSSMGLDVYAPSPTTTATIAHASASLMNGDVAQIAAAAACPFVLPPYSPPTPPEQPPYQLSYQQPFPRQSQQASLSVSQIQHQDNLPYQMNATGIMSQDIGSMTTPTMTTTTLSAPSSTSSSSSSSSSPSSSSPPSMGRAKPRCWEHGCNGRQFSTFSNLLRHQREKSGQAAKATCPNCGAEFTRTTARNGHVQHEKCKRRVAGGGVGA